MLSGVSPWPFPQSLGVSVAAISRRQFRLERESNINKGMEGVRFKVAEAAVLVQAADAYVASREGSGA